MAEIAYINKRFQADALRTIVVARKICADYASSGYDLTLRQLYYQFVAHDLFPDDRTWTQLENKKWIRDPDGTKNAEPNYKWLGDIINDARLAGYLDWKYIVDRTRNAHQQTHWKDPTEIIGAAADGYAIDKWGEQEYRVEVWIEKDALAGVLESCCPALDVTYFACRGYTSQSEIWNAAQRLRGYIKRQQKVRVIHLGDHDPSGIDMTRDVEERLGRFIAQDLGYCGPDEDAQTCLAELYPWLEIRRIALNFDQIRRYDPPPNPAKLSDSRGAGYVQKYGYSSWELDALDPPVLVSLVQDAVGEFRDADEWERAIEREEREQAVLKEASERWEEIEGMLDAKSGPNGA